MSALAGEATDGTPRRLRASLAVAISIVTFSLLAASASAGPPAPSTGASGTIGATAATGSTAPTDLLTPPPGEILSGISGDDAREFAAETGKHPAVFGSFVTWGHSEDWAFNDAAGSRARVMLHIGTTIGAASGGITPAAIAAGHGDSYLLQLVHTIAAHKAPVYIRLLPEMNNAHNPYSADDLAGSPRGAAYSHPAFISAWRRSVTILRGGPVSTIDAKLAALNLPSLQGVASSVTLPSSPVAFIWCPETAGTPNVPSESAASYWPGSEYVDWVGTDFYSAFPNFAGLNAFYKRFGGKPFAFAEWAMWESDSAGFVNEFFDWIAKHPRVKMILYNEGYGPASQLLLAKYPAAIPAIRARLDAPRFAGYTSEWQPRTLAATGASGTTTG